MSFRQIKSPALADRSIVSSKLDQSAVKGQSALTGMLNPADCFTLLYDVGSDSLKKIGADQFFGSFSTSDLPEGDKLYFTDAKAQAAVAQDISDAVATETTRASAAEQLLTTSLAAEVTRATAAEGVNAAAITAETTRATNAEGVNATAIATETTRATGVETGLRTDVNANTSGVAANAAAIQVEVTRAKAAETVNANAIAAETTARTSGDAANATAISNEITARAAGDLALRTDVDANALDIIGLDSDLSSEIARATAAEGVNAAAIASEITRATAAEGLNATAIATETTRATGIEAGLRTDVDLNTSGVAANSTAIASEIVRAKAAEVVNANAISAEVIRATSIEGGLRTDVDTVTSRVDAIVGTSPQTLDTLQEIVAAFEDADSDIQNIISANSGRLTVNEGDIDALETRASSLEVRATSVEGRATTLEASQAVQDGRLVANESDILGLQTKQGSATLVTVASDLSGAVNELHTEMGLESAKVAILETEMDTVEGRASILENRADSLDSDVLVHAGRLTVNEGDIDSLESKMGSGSFDTTAQTVIGSSNELHGEINAIEARVDSAEADILTNAAAISAESTRALGQEALIRGEFAAADAVVTTAYTAADAVVLASAKSDATTKANNAEAAAKIYADGLVTDEAVDRANADAVLQSAITAEQTARQNADATLSSRATALETEMTATQAGAGLAVDGSYAAPTGTSYLNASSSLKDASIKLDAAIDAEKTRALGIEGSLQTQITSEAASRVSGDSALQSSLAAEVARAVAAEGVLSTNVTANATAISNEATARQNADQSLQSQIDFITANTDSAALDSLTEIVAAFQAADGTITGLITQNQTDIATNATAISNEATARSTADIALGARIDNLVTDVVAEGTTNLYFTTTRARESISAAGSLAYNSATGVISYTTPSTDGIAEGSTNLYFTDTRARLAVTLTTDNTDAMSYNPATGAFTFSLASVDTGEIAEGSQLYFTTARARGAVSAGSNISYDEATGVISTHAAVDSVNGKTNVVVLGTDDINEGTTNKYFTNARAAGAISLASDNNDILSYNSGTGALTFVTPTTDAISEGANNLYYTDARADARIANASVFDLADVNSGAMSDGYTLVWSSALQKFVPQNIAVTATTLNFTGDGTTQDFSTGVEVTSIDNTQVYINGLIQAPTYSYTLSTTGGVSSIVFDQAPEANDYIFVRVSSTSTLTAGGVLNEQSNIDGGTY